MVSKRFENEKNVWIIVLVFFPRIQEKNNRCVTFAGKVLNPHGLPLYF